ncbi:gliding motility-associated C-terminal domain-containing protein, partial [Flavobacterium sp. XGLA_31]|uniref:gliding motility-associated C-terminal domain-containing protein n=1 Tax=Flavobacterium sp. XGLA_31 TaxID=3447666 RepID=UPI003F3AE8F9
NTNEDATITINLSAMPNAGTAVTVSPICSSIGVLDLNTLLTGQDPGGSWLDSALQPVTSPINISTFIAGTYTYTYRVTNGCGSDERQVQFTVLPTPTLTSLNVTAATICIGNNGIINFNGMTDGVYTLNYDLGGVNPLANQQITVTIIGGIGNFTIPSALLSNSGITVISFTKITDNATNCFSLLGVTTNLLVKPLADITPANLSITNVCFGSPVIVNISGASGLSDGIYQFNYSIPGANPTGGTTVNVDIISGVGQFVLPASLFASSGTYTITIVGIVAVSSGGCTNPLENAAANFAINPIPDLLGATVTVQTTCPNFDSVATISGALNLNDGIYNIEYNLTGANTSGTVTATVTIAGGMGTLTIPAASLVNSGTTTITITSIVSTTTGCGGPLTTQGTATFEVIALAPPTLITDGNIFCDDNQPTVANLTANITGGQTVIWYNAPTGGTAYNETDLLVNGTIYYAAAVASSGCESTARLQVIADLTGCPDIIIPDGFSPNNDGINDTFVINNLPELYPNFKLEIYNRYGNLVYQGNINTPNWDGTTTEGGLKLGTNLLPTGVYFFIINFNDGNRAPLQDRVYLSR